VCRIVATECYTHHHQELKYLPYETQSNTIFIFVTHRVKVYILDLLKYIYIVKYIFLIRVKLGIDLAVSVCIEVEIQVWPISIGTAKELWPRTF